MIVYNCKYAGPAATKKAVNHCKSGKSIDLLKNKNYVDRITVKYVKGKFGVGLKGLFQKHDYEVLEKQARDALK